MMTFDDILPAVREILAEHQADVKQIDWLVINRDLYGQVRLIAPETAQEDNASRSILERLAVAMAERLGAHAYPPASAILYENNKALVCQDVVTIPLEDHANVLVVDRLATESNWASITPETNGTPRVVFFSIKGGVGRSTALAATAWWFAQAGKRVLVLDMDLESPGLSSSLLPSDRQPKYGIIDWLVEDLVDNGDAVLDDMIATSGLSHNGEIYVVPAHGADPGEYVAKLGRVQIPKMQSNGTQESWSCRLRRLLQALEERIRPDVVLIDTSAGINDVSSACVTNLDANLVLLFAQNDSQTWNGYRILFEHWRRTQVAKSLRERLQVVAAMTRDVQEGGALGDRQRFEAVDEDAQHAPLEVRWHSSFVALKSLHGRFTEINVDSVDTIFGSLIRGLNSFYKS